MVETRTPDLQPALLCVLSAAIDEGSKLRGGSLGIVPQGWEQSSRSLLPATQPAGPQPRTKRHALPLGLAREVAQRQPLLIANLPWISRQSCSCECLGYLVLPQPLLATTQGAPSLPPTSGAIHPRIARGHMARDAHPAAPKASLSRQLIGRGRLCCCSVLFLSLVPASPWGKEFSDFSLRGTELRRESKNIEV